MKKTIMFGLVLIGILVLIGCTQQEKISCNSVSAPTVNVVCRDAGVYQEFNVETGQNEYKPKKYCYAYPSGEQNIVYRGVGYQEDGVEQDGGEIASGGSIKVGVYHWLSYVEVFPNLDGNFCKEKATKVYKRDFVVEK